MHFRLAVLSRASESHPVPRLVIIGGAEDKTGECTVLRELVRLAGGSEARIALVPAATTIPNEVAEDYRALFLRLGVAEVQTLHVQTRDDAKDPALAAYLEQATGVFFTGGDQLRLMGLIGGTPLDTILHVRVQQGLLVAGTSAGAAVMSTTMIVSGESDAPTTGEVRTGPGLELLPGVIIDQHFAQRGRIGRLLSVVAQFPHEIGIGIDEDTALVVAGHACRVIGSGAVTILDAGGASFNNAFELPFGSRIALHGVTLHCLPSGGSFDLLERRPLPVHSPEVPS